MPLEPPSVREFVLMTIVCAAVMVGLYSGLGGRNAALLAQGAHLFTPRTGFDDALPLIPTSVVAYYLYFPLLIFLSVLTARDRNVMYEGVIAYAGGAAMGFAFFYFLPSRMVQPDLASCTSTTCAWLDVMYRVDDGFNIFPSMHVGYSTVVWAFFHRYMREVSPFVGLVALSIIVSTLLCKRHYLVDIPAGLTLAAIDVWLARRLGPVLARAMLPIGPQRSG